MDPELADRLDTIAADVAALKAAMDEWLPLVHAYLNPDQSGPRGYFMRHRMAKMNGVDRG